MISWYVNSISSNADLIYLAIQYNIYLPTHSYIIIYKFKFKFLSIYIVNSWRGDLKKPLGLSSEVTSNCTFQKEKKSTINSLTRTYFNTTGDAKLMYLNKNSIICFLKEERPDECFICNGKAFQIFGPWQRIVNCFRLVRQA